MISFSVLLFYGCKPSECASTQDARSAAKGAIHRYPETDSTEVEGKAKALAELIGEDTKPEFIWLREQMTVLAAAMADQRKPIDAALDADQAAALRADFEHKVTRAKDALEDVDRVCN